MEGLFVSATPGEPERHVAPRFVIQEWIRGVPDSCIYDRQ